jgi:hypothetical protein
MSRSTLRSSFRDLPGSLVMLATVGLLGMALAGGSACAELERVDLGVCGNRILEPEFGEDCDGSAISFGEDATCGAPGSPAACRLTCDPGASASRCPPGWGCGIDGICRRPDAQFELVTVPGLARGVGDLDGDGRDDVVLRGTQGEAQVAFFGTGRVLAELFVDPARRPISDSPAVQPIVTRMSTDGVDDLALPLIGDDVTIRVFMGSTSRQLADPFVELVTAPFASAGTRNLYTAFNPRGVPQQICDVGGCTQTLVLGKTDANDTRYAVLEDRRFIPLFTLPEDHEPQTTAVARWDAARSCDILGVSYRYSDEGSPGNLVEFFPLCAGPNQFNQSEQLAPLGTVDAIASVSLSELEAGFSLELAGQGDVNADGHPDLLLNVTDNDAATLDDPQTYVAYGVGDGRFNTLPDLSGSLDLADRATPLIRGHSWATDLTDPDLRIEHATWPRAMADINQDGHVDFLLTAGVVALSSPDPTDQCLIAGEAVLAGPPVGPSGEPLWGYACLLVTDGALIDAETATRPQVVRNWRTTDSLATIVDLRGDGLPGFAGIDKNTIKLTDQSTDHSPKDFLDLIWLDKSSSQLVLHTIEATRHEQVAAGDIDGDATVDLVYGGGSSLQVIWGPPHDPARAVNFSPVGFDILRVFGEGLPSASLGAERDGRLTIFRDGQWPALALTQPEACAVREDCHVRFASGVLGDPVHVDHFAWALGLVQSTDSGGLRLLRAISGEAELGPAYDSVATDPVPLSELGMTAAASRSTVLSVELGEGPEELTEHQGPDAQQLGATDEALVAGRTDEGLELAVLRPRIESSPTGPLCSGLFMVDVGHGQTEFRFVCFEVVTQLYVPGAVRGHGVSDDPFIEIGDADGDGNLDISWVTTAGKVMLLQSDGTGTLSADRLVELSLLDPVEGDDEAERPTRIDWVRWLELDGTQGRELVSGDLLGTGLIWGLNVGFESGALDPRGALEIDGLDARSMGHVGDFDGDGVDDLAIAGRVLFGQPVND